MRRWISLLVALTLLTGAVACGEKKVPAKTWAKDVCGTVRPWARGIQTSVASTRSATGPRTSPATAKLRLQRVFRDAVKSSDKAIKGIDKAGVPDVKDGDKIAKDFRSALVGARAAFAKAEKATGKADTTDRKAFDRDVGRIGAALSKDYEAAAKAINVTRSAELKRAFDQAPQCTR